jgi:hypothetical protein
MCYKYPATQYLKGSLDDEKISPYAVFQHGRQMSISNMNIAGVSEKMRSITGLSTRRGDIYIDVYVFINILIHISYTYIHMYIHIYIHIYI